MNLILLQLISACERYLWSIIRISVINYPCPKYIILGLYSLSGKTSYRKISWSLKAAGFGFKLFQSLWNLAATSAAMLPRCLSNFRAIRPLQHPISRLRDFTRYGGKTSYRLVNRGPGLESICLWKLSLEGGTSAATKYCQISNTRRTKSHNVNFLVSSCSCLYPILEARWLVENEDVVGASPFGAAPMTSSFSTSYLASMDWAKTTCEWSTILLPTKVRFILEIWR